MLDSASLPEHWSLSSESLRWKSAIRGKGFSSPILVYGQVLVTTAFQARSDRLPALVFVHANAQQPRLRTISSEGRTTVIEASDRFRGLAENALLEPMFASPALADGFLILRGEDHLFRIDA